MFKKTTSSLDTIGLENKIGPKMEMGPPVFKIPKNLFLFTVVYHSEEHKNKLYGIHPDGCRDIDELMDDFNTYKKKFVMVKQESTRFLPEGAPCTSSPHVAESQPSTAQVLQPSSSIPSLEQGEAKEVLSNFQPRVRHVLRVGRIKNDLEYHPVGNDI